MSLNSSHAGKEGVILFNTERILIFHDGIELSFEKNEDVRLKGKKNGRIFLTTHRAIFINKDQKDKLLSFSMPFHTLKGLELEQPVFGANYISGKVIAEQGGDWQGDAKFKMWFNKGGAIEFGQTLLQAGKLASRYAPPQPPAYSPPTAPYYQAPPPAYAPPTGQLYGFVPYSVFPTAPPVGSVFMYNVPPPYPGVDPNLAPYPFTDPGAPAGQSFSSTQPPPYAPAAGSQSPYNPQAPGGQPPYGAPGGQPPYGPPGGQPPYGPPGGMPPYGAPGSQPPYYGPPGGQPPYNSYGAVGGQPPYGPPGGQPPYGPPGGQPPYGPPGGQLPYGPPGGQPPFNANQSAAAAAKEAEAFGYGGQAFYDPSHPQNVYMPPTSSQPPPYSEGSKKND